MNLLQRQNVKFKSWKNQAGWRFKGSEFRKYRIIGYLEDEKLIITVLTVEGRSDSCKNKEVLAKKARKEVFKKK
ncbi:MAG: hypothetical protein MSL09_01880 [Spirochaetia bacterium]|nr:hypothetical protein [Spirochaetia bacterium]